MRFSPLISSKVRPFSLRLILILPFILQITATVGLVGYLSFRNSQIAINDLAEQLEQAVGERVNQMLGSYLKTPEQVVQANLNAIQLGPLDVNQLEATGRHFWHQVVALAAQMGTQDQRYQAFTQRIQQLAQPFQAEQIEQLIQPYLTASQRRR